MGYAYFGEAAGPRIIRSGVGFAQVGDPYRLDVRTWDAEPAGPVGDVVFRSIEITLRHRLGFEITVTPYLNGLALAAKVFSAPPPTGLEDQLVTVPVYVGRRGTALAVRVQSHLPPLGELELVNAGHTHAIVRTTP